VGSKGKFQSQIYWRHKLRHIGVFNSRGDASDAYLAMKKILELFDTSRSGIGDRTLDVMFDAAKKSVRESYRGFVADKRDLPSGVRILPSGKHKSMMYRDGKEIYVGTFASRDEAVAALEARKTLHDDAAAKKKAPIVSDTSSVAAAAEMLVSPRSTRPRKAVKFFEPGQQSNPSEEYGLAPHSPSRRILTGVTGGVTREAREKIEAAGKATKARVENMMEGFECDVERQRARLVRLFDAKKKAADSSRQLRRSTRRIKRKDRSEDGDLIFSQEEMTLEQFKEWKSVMSEVNKEFTKKRTEDSKPALSQLDLTADQPSARRQSPC
jgi:hypothetical protein